VVDVSVIIPTAGRDGYLGEALRSVLGQPAVTLEVVVVDDLASGETRRAVEAAGDGRVRYLARDVPSGRRPALLRNEGAWQSSGRFLLFLDDDDLLWDGALPALVRALDGAPGAGVAFGAIVPFGGAEAELRHEQAYYRVARRRLGRARGRLRLAALLLFENAPLASSACLFRRDAFAALGGFDPAMPVCQDGDLVLRAARSRGFAFLDAPVVHRRIGHETISRALPRDDRHAHAYRIMHAKYAQAHGALEFYALKGLVRLLGPARRGLPGG
jgi:glycosyltransferase involved in cell wall biosynthesis